MKEKQVKTETTNSENESSDIDTSDDDIEVADNSSKVDDALDSYEEYVDSYIKFLKKAQKGDNSAMAEYPALMQKTTDMQMKIDDMKNDFSTKQMSRMMKIQTKMTTAALDMQ